MKFHLVVFAYLCLTISISFICFCQGNNYDTVVTRIASKLEKKFAHKYYVGGIDGDQQMEDRTMDKSKIKDPYHTLAGRFVFFCDGEFGENLYKPNSYVGIYEYKSDSILWCSVPLPEDFSSGALGNISETDEINKDGKVEIVIEQFKEPRGEIEELWIFNWDGVKGNLITKLNEDGESIIKCETGNNLFDADGDDICEIQGIGVIYSWNGKLFGDWGKTSKYYRKKR
jgi:hypothetical protein